MYVYEKSLMWSQNRSLQIEAEFGLYYLGQEGMFIDSSRFLLSVCTNVINITQLECEQQREDEQFETLEDYLEALEDFPENFPLYVKHLTEPGEEWSDLDHGVFPRDGLLCISAKIPSGRNSSH